MRYDLVEFSADWGLSPYGGLRGVMNRTDYIDWNL